MDLHNNIKLIHSALTHFSNEQVLIANYETDFYITFETVNGKPGFVEYNTDDLTWDLFLNGDLIYKIEGEIFDVIEYNEGGDILDLVEFIDSIEVEDYQLDSIDYLNLVKDVLMRLIEESTQPIEVGYSKFSFKYKFYLN